MKVVTYVHKGKVTNVPLEDFFKMKVELSNAYEEVCINCGKCCFDKKLVRGVNVINYNSPCNFLKFMGRKSRCEVYSDRFAKCGKCLPVPKAIKQRALPSSCPYVKDIAGYKAPVDDGTWYKRVRQTIAKYDSPVAGTPTGLDSSYRSNAPTSPYPHILSREDLGKPQDWRARREALRRKIQTYKQSRGQAGISDPRTKTKYSIKPSGHALGG